MPAAMPRIDQANWIPILGSVTTGRNDLSTTPLQVLDPDPSRKSIVIHNPNYIDGGEGSANLLLAQTIDPTWDIPGGGFVLFAGDSMLIEGDAAQGPWFACTDISSGWSITIITSMK